MTQFAVNPYFDDIDKAAAANLDERDLREFHRYKQKLIDMGYPDDDVEITLEGFIWDCIEGYTVH
jgi:hypothetical protein